MAFTKFFQTKHEKKYSVFYLPADLQRDERIGDRKKKYPTKLENFRIEYFYV
jgi:hypothetical protein